MSTSYVLLVSWILYVTSACIIPGRRRATEKWHKPCCISGALLSEKVLCPETHLRQLSAKLKKALDSSKMLMNETELRVNSTRHVESLKNYSVAYLNDTVDKRTRNIDQMQNTMKCDLKNMAILVMNWEEMKKDENRVDGEMMEYDKMDFRNTTQELYSSMCSLSWLLKSLGCRINHEVTKATHLNRTAHNRIDKYSYNFILLKDTIKMLKKWNDKYITYKNANRDFFHM